MSEYQYYEFQVVDRPLKQEQMGELRGIPPAPRSRPAGRCGESQA